jgi:Ca-activated chloride channel homolog
MTSYREREIYRYPIFQIPAIALAICLVATLLAMLLGLGKPAVAVSVFVDLSDSTTNVTQLGNGSEKIVDAEVRGVKAYIESNTKLSTPNQLQIFGFAGDTSPLNKSFQTDKEQINKELDAALAGKENLKRSLQSNKTDIDKAIDTGVTALNQTNNACKQILLITDGEANVSPESVAKAISSNVKINAVVIGTPAPLILAAVLSTGGKYLPAVTNDIALLFSDELFSFFNSNIRWVVACLGAAWIALMWMLFLPIDRWLLQSMFRFDPSRSGTLAMMNALFWSVLTPLIVFRLFGLPFISHC